MKQDAGRQSHLAHHELESDFIIINNNNISIIIGIISIIIIINHTSAAEGMRPASSHISATISALSLFRFLRCIDLSSL